MLLADRLYIAQMFREFSGYAEYEEVCYQRRERRTENERRRRARMRELDPKRWQELLRRSNASYHERKRNPQWIANRRAKGTAWMRKHRAKRGDGR